VVAIVPFKGGTYLWSNSLVSLTFCICAELNSGEWKIG